MLDAQNAVAAAPAVIRREDYRPPDWLVPEISLDFDLDAEKTVVRATLQVERNGAHRAPLRLEGDAIKPFGPGERRRPSSGGGRRSPRRSQGDAPTVEIVTELNPRANTQLMGLYASGGMLCTQCEARGLPPDHLLPRPARRAEPLPGADDAPTRRAFRCCSRTATAMGARRSAGRAALGRMARSLPQALLPVRAGRGRSRRQPRHASPPARAARSSSASGCATADLPRTAHAMASAQGGDEVGRGGLWPRI